MKSDLSVASVLQLCFAPGFLGAFLCISGALNGLTLEENVTKLKRVSRPRLTSRRTGPRCAAFPVLSGEDQKRSLLSSVQMRQNSRKDTRLVKQTGGQGRGARDEGLPGYIRTCQREESHLPACGSLPPPGQQAESRFVVVCQGWKVKSGVSLPTGRGGHKRFLRGATFNSGHRVITRRLKLPETTCVRRKSRNSPTPF